MAEILKFYNNKVEIGFDDDKHVFFHLKTREKITSVTEVLKIINKPELEAWKLRTAQNELIDKYRNGYIIDDDCISLAFKKSDSIRKDAAEKGKAIHAWCEEYIKCKIKNEKFKPVMPKDDQIANGVIAFLKWEKEAKINKYVASERKIYSKKYDYSGILDIKAIISKKWLTTLDIKTGNAVYDEVRFQLSAYQQADYEELKQEYSDVRWALRFDKNTAEFEATPLADHKKDFDTFLGALQIVKRKKELSGKTIKIKKAVELPY